MRRPWVRFALACLLFLGWIGYLVFLVLTSAHPVVVSRPQMLVADLVVAARIDSLDGPCTVEEVLLARDGVEAPADKTIQVENLRDCKRPPRDDEDPTLVPLDWTGTGTYLLLLHPVRDGKTYRVVDVPPSPGFPRNGKTTPRLYRRTDDAVRQVRAMIPAR